MNPKEGEDLRISLLEGSHSASSPCGIQELSSVNRKAHFGPVGDSVLNGGMDPCNLGIPSPSGPLCGPLFVHSEDRDERMLKAEIGVLIQGLVPDKFILEGCCNTSRSNRVLNCESCTPIDSFLERDVGGHHVCRMLTSFTKIPSAKIELCR